MDKKRIKLSITVALATVLIATLIMALLPVKVDISQSGFLSLSSNVALAVNNPPDSEFTEQSYSWLEGGWDQRVKFTTDNTDIDATLSNFPTLLYLSTSSGRNSDDVSFVFDELTSDANRKKIAVTTSDEVTECYVEIEKWDDANEQAWLWVKVPSIASDADTDLYLYYDSSHADNDAYVGDPSDAIVHNVWDANFKLVSHLQDDPDTSNVRDSTVNANDGAKKGAAEPAVTDGKISKGQDFAGDDEYIGLGNTGFPEGAAQRTISFWFNADVFHVGIQRALFGYESGVGDGHSIMICAEDDGVSVVFGGHREIIEKGNLSTGTWYRFTYVFPLGGANTDDSLYYLNGALKTPALEDGEPRVMNTDTPAAPKLGSNTPGNAYFYDGKLDEVRISDTTRNAAWDKASYESERDHLLDFGSEETRVPEITNLPASKAFGILEVNTYSSTAINYFTIENTGSGAVDVTVHATDLTGGDDTWDLSDTATPGENIYGLKAGLDDEDDLFDVVVRETEPYNELVNNLLEDATQDWGLRLYMPTSVTDYDGQQMSATLTLVASAHT